jgi:hypothetical protein
MTTKSEDVRAMAKAHRENGWPHTDTAEVLEACADLIDQLAKGYPIGYVYQEPDSEPVFDYAAERWTKHGAVLWTEMPVYTHPSPDRAEPMK